jgi:lysophospholipase L1-like esterase
MSETNEHAPNGKRPRQLEPVELGAAELHDPSLPAIGEHRAPGSHVGLLDVEEGVHEVVLAADDETAAAPLPLKVFHKLLTALGTFALLVAASYAIPLPWAQPWRADEDYIPFWNVIGRELLGEGAAIEAEAEEAARVDELARQLEAEEPELVEDRQVIAAPPPDELVFAPYEGHELDPGPEDLVITLDNPEALAPFYTALTLSDAGYAGAITRVGHWGDSVLGNDGITSAIRRRMQARFGDAGHGFHALKKYDSSYRHQGVRFEELGKVRWQSCFIRNRCREDGRYGYGGVTVWSPGGAHSRFATAQKGSVGREASVFEVWYAQRQGGGKLRVRIDDEVQIVDTARPGEPAPKGEEPESVDAWARFEVPDGPHVFEVRAAGGGLVRAYGVVLERELPGVVWDGKALIGSFTNRLAAQDPEHLAGQLGHRGLDLMVFTFGGNDMTRDKSDLRKSMDPYIADYGRVLELFRAARPEAACLIMGPVDHGERVGGRIVSRPIVARMTEAQREVARAHGCAFFDTLAAMGGPGSIARWHNRGLMSADLAHPSAGGHKLLGAMVYAALLDGYVTFRKSRTGQKLSGRPNSDTE